MIKYNWIKLNNAFSWKPEQVLKYFYVLSNVPCPYQQVRQGEKRVIKELHEYARNYSFIHGSKQLLTNHAAISEIYEYIQVASIRSYFDYKMRNIDWVYRWQAPRSINIHNPLFRIENDKVYLKYDSYKQEK